MQNATKSNKELIRISLKKIVCVMGTTEASILEGVATPKCDLLHFIDILSPSLYLIFFIVLLNILRAKDEGEDALPCELVLDAPSHLYIYKRLFL